MFPEAVAGLALLAVLTGILTLAGGHHAHVSQRNAAQLELQRVAQQALLLAQRGSPLPPTSQPVSVTVEPLPANGSDVQWIAVTARRDGRFARLLGPMLSGGKP